MGVGEKGLGCYVFMYVDTGKCEINSSVVFMLKFGCIFMVYVYILYKCRNLHHFMVS